MLVKHTDATKRLTDGGYVTTSYPDTLDPIHLIVALNGRTVTTLPVKGGSVCGESVDYLVSEQGYAKDAGRR